MLGESTGERNTGPSLLRWYVFILLHATKRLMRSCKMKNTAPLPLMAMTVLMSNHSRMEKIWFDGSKMKTWSFPLKEKHYIDSG
jgi:hypothetical protein